MTTQTRGEPCPTCGIDSIATIYTSLGEVLCTEYYCEGCRTAWGDEPDEHFYTSDMSCNMTLPFKSFTDIQKDA